MIVYITRDIERALGRMPGPDYHIIANATADGAALAAKYPGCIGLIQDPSGVLGTGDLMRHPEAVSFMQGAKDILVFKNTARIEPVARELGLRLLNPPAALSETIENKVSQIAWLGPLAARYLPPYRIETAGDICWTGTPFVIQWAHGHTGGGTILVESEEVLADIRARFPRRRARVSAYIAGASYTVNAVAATDGVHSSSPSYQITGLAPFTDNAFSTIGNDWSLASDMLTAQDRAAIRTMTDEIGALMRDAGWRGLFGIDLVRETSTGRMYLIEINARQPASATFESALQLAGRETAGAGHETAGGETTRLTTFEAHLAALRGLPVGGILPVARGAQIVQRVTGTTATVPAGAAGELERRGYTVMTYPNTEHNADLIRIQHHRGGFMAGHEEFGPDGRKVLGILSGL